MTGLKIKVSFWISFWMLVLVQGVLPSDSEVQSLGKLIHDQVFTITPIFSMSPTFGDTATTQTVDRQTSSIIEVHLSTPGGQDATLFTKHCSV